MKAALFILPRAKAHLHAIADYYESEACLDLAWEFQKKFDEALDLLARNPELGRKRHFRHPKLKGLRSWRMDKFRQYLIFYRFEADKLVVITVIHAARNLGTALLTDTI